MQFSPLAMMRAVVVLPTPRTPGHHEGMGDAVRLERVAQGAHHRLLPDQVGKGLRPVFPGKNLIGLGLGHAFLERVRRSVDGGAGRDNGGRGRGGDFVARWV